MENPNKITDDTNPNIWIEQKCVDGNLETWRVIKSTTGDISNGNDLVETITLTKTLLTTTSNA